MAPVRPNNNIKDTNYNSIYGWFESFYRRDQQRRSDIRQRRFSPFLFTSPLKMNIDFVRLWQGWDGSMYRQQHANGGYINGYDISLTARTSSTSRPGQFTKIVKSNKIAKSETRFGISFRPFKDLG